MAEGIADIAATHVMGPQHDLRVECAVVIPVAAIVPCAHPLGLGPAGTGRRELFDVGVRWAGGSRSARGWSATGSPRSKSSYAHSVFRQCAAQVRAARGRRLP